MSAASLQAIADIAAVNRDRVLYYDVVDKFEWRPGEYADNNSCYWGSYTAARTHYLPKLGVRAVRSYSKTSSGEHTGNGRFWLMPFVPNDNGNVDYMLAFNFYGTFGGGTNVNEIALHILGDDWEIRKEIPQVRLTIDNSYVNNGTANIYVRKGARNPQSGLNITTLDMISSIQVLP